MTTDQKDPEEKDPKPTPDAEKAKAEEKARENAGKTFQQTGTEKRG